MVSTIPVALIEPWIHILAWEHAPSEPTGTSTPEAKPSSNDSRNCILSREETDSGNAAETLLH